MYPRRSAPWRATSPGVPRKRPRTSAIYVHRFSGVLRHCGVAPDRASARAEPAHEPFFQDHLIALGSRCAVTLIDPRGDKVRAIRV